MDKIRVGAVHYVSYTSRSLDLQYKSERDLRALCCDFYASSPGHDLFTVSKQLAIRFQRNFACILMGSVRIAVQNFIDLVFDLDLSRSQMCKITFWAIPRFLLDKSSPNFNTG